MRVYVTLVSIDEVHLYPEGIRYSYNKIGELDIAISLARLEGRSNGS
jgi:hypothetical protein